MKFFVLIAFVCTASFAIGQEAEEKVQKKRSLYDGYSGYYGSAGLPSISSHTHTHSSAVIERPVPVPVPSYPLKSSFYPSNYGFDNYGLGYPSSYSTPLNKFSLSSYPSTYSSYPYDSYGLSSISYNKLGSSILPYNNGYNYPKSLPTFSREFYPSYRTYSYPSIYTKSYYSSPTISKWWWRSNYFSTSVLSTFLCFYRNFSHSKCLSFSVFLC